MMRNEVGGRILPPQIPQKEPKIWRFPPKTSKLASIHVNIRALFKRPLTPLHESTNLTDVVGNAITWVFGSVTGLPKPWVARTLMLEEGTLGCLRSDVIHSGGGGERDS